MTNNIVIKITIFYFSTIKRYVLYFATEPGPWECECNVITASDIDFLAS